MPRPTETPGVKVAPSIRTATRGVIVWEDSSNENTCENGTVCIDPPAWSDPIARSERLPTKVSLATERQRGNGSWPDRASSARRNTRLLDDLQDMVEIDRLWQA